MKIILRHIIQFCETITHLPSHPTQIFYQHKNFFNYIEAEIEQKPVFLVLGKSRNRTVPFKITSEKKATDFFRVYPDHKFFHFINKEPCKSNFLTPLLVSPKCCPKVQNQNSSRFNMKYAESLFGI